MRSAVPPRLRPFRFAVILLVLAGGACGRAEEPPNNDQDFTRPRPRFDLRYQFQDKAGGVEQSTFILRRDQPIPLSRDWKIATRIDVPFVVSNGTGRDNPEGRTEFGTGDLLTEAVL